MLDYIIVGNGIAGVSFAIKLLEQNKSFVMIDNDNKKSSSRVAAGFFNPYVLKRFTPVWNVQKQMELLFPFWQKIEKITHSNYIQNKNIYRVFNSIEEQNIWCAVSETPCGLNYLNSNIIYNNIQGISAELGFGEVKNTGRILLKKMLCDMRNYFTKMNILKSEDFDYTQLRIEKNKLCYKELQTSKIIFCEGFGMKNNPYFNDLPLVGSKGELLKIKSIGLNLDKIVKAGVFILPLEEKETFLVGATFSFDDKTTKITTKAREELTSRLKKVLKLPFEVLEQKVGIRPTVIDRKPLLGRHKQHRNLYVFNGLGTRGVMIAPQMVEKIYNYIEHKEELDKELDINRFN